MKNNKSSDASTNKPAQKPKRASEVKVLVLVCWGAIAMLAPFLFIRIQQKNEAMILLDGLAIAFLFSTSVYMWVTRQLHTPTILLNIVCISCVVFACYTSNLASVIHWLYPAMMWGFYLSNAFPLFALVINTIAALALAPLVINLPLLDALHIAVSIILTNLLAYIFVTRAHLKQQRLRLQMDLDPLTSIGNRRAMYRQLKEAAHTVETSELQISVVILDIDHFKRINDTFGHAKGDEVLKKFAAMLSNNTRKNDFCFRYGGEEFLVLAMGTNLDGASILAENLRKATEIMFSQVGFVGQSITVSLGIAQWKSGESSKSVLARADQALYRAKRQGRNSVGVSQSEDDVVAPSDLSPIKLTNFLTKKKGE